MGVVVNPFAYALGGGQGVSAGGGGPDGTQYYVEVTIASSEVSSTLTDFPVYVDLSDFPAAFFTNVQSDGGDIRVTESDGTTRCATELVAIDTGASTGELHFLASSISSSSDTTFRIYYDGGGSLSQPGAATTYGRNAVWSNYDLVAHYNEDPSGTAPQMVDSTGTGNDGTSAGSMTSGDLVTGQLGDALEFDGSNDYVDHGNDSSLNYTGTSITLQAWVYFNTISTTQYRIIDKYTGAGDDGYGLWTTSARAPEMRFLSLSGGTVSASTTLSATTWYMLHGTYDGANSRIYVNGSDDGNSSLTGSIPGNLSLPLQVGKNNQGGGHVPGIIDEVRVTGTTLSADWIAAEYTNQNTPTTFYTIGTQQAA